MMVHEMAEESDGIRVEDEYDGTRDGGRVRWHMDDGRV